MTDEYRKIEDVEKELIKTHGTAEEISNSIIEAYPSCSSAEKMIMAMAIRRLGEALRFYAIADNYDDYTELRKFAPGFGTFDADTCKVLEDGGHTARKALSSPVGSDEEGEE